MFNLSRVFTFIFTLFLSALASAKTTLIIYCSIGMGHISASKAIEDRIKTQDPTATVILKDIRDFMPAWQKKIDEKLYFWVFKNLPQTFDKAYHGVMQKGLQAKDLSELENSYDEKALLEYIKETRAENVIATHYGAAISLGNLKAEGSLPGLKTAWVHTDYIEHFFPRISQRLDKTFLGHSKLSEFWLKAGVTDEKIEVTGIPVRKLPELGEVSRKNTLEAIGLKETPITFVMSGGSDGLKDYPTAVKSLASQFNKPIQIIAICGRNESAKNGLEKLKTKLPKNVTLVPMGFIPNKQLIDLISASDLYITKAGGLSPTEGALMVKPLLLINEYTGHEAENADFFKKTELAEVVNHSADLGQQAEILLANKELLSKMQDRQRDYRNSINIDYISSWAQSDAGPENVQVDLGLKEGAEVTGASAALNRLEKEFPAQVEIFLNYPKSKVKGYFGDGSESNPFGHIAIRINDKVYTINHLAERGSEPHILHKTSVEEFLYSTKPVYKNEEFTGMQGMAYARDTISLRIDGFESAAIQNMLRELENVDSDWIKGRLTYNAKKCNCADVTLRILKAGGLVTSGKIFDRAFRMPLDVFDVAAKSAELRTDLTTSVIHYGMVKGSKNEYRTSGFPLSLYQLKKSILNIFKKGKDPREKAVDSRVLVDKSSRDVRFENVSRASLSSAPLRTSVSHPVCRRVLLQTAEAM